MKKERSGLTNGYGGIRPFDPGGQTKKMSPKTPFNTFGRFNDRPISSNNGEYLHKINLRTLKEICVGDTELLKTKTSTYIHIYNFDALDFNKKKEEVLKETEAIFSDEDEVVDLEAELRQKLKDEKQSSFAPPEDLHDDFEDLQGEDEIEFPPAPSGQQIRGRSNLRSDHVTKSHDLVKSHDHDFDDIGTSFALHETEPNLVKIEESKKKIMLWSNPSPFGSSINQPKIIRHVEAPKPKGYTPVPPTQKFSPAGNFSIKHGQPTRERYFE